MNHSFNVSSFAAVDPSIGFDGLWVPSNGLKRTIEHPAIDPDSGLPVIDKRTGEQKMNLFRPPLNVAPRRFGDSLISFQGVEQLGEDDQSVYLAICALAGIDGLMVYSSSAGEISRQLRSGLNLTGRNVAASVSMITTDAATLAREAGYKDPNGAWRCIQASINRLRNAQIREVWKGQDRASNLISASFNKDTGEMHVCINPREAAALIGGQFVKISLAERRMLDSSISKLLHAWLCMNVRLGHPLGYGNGVAIDSLIPHVWGFAPAAAPVMSKRRGLICDALADIKAATNIRGGDLAWEIEFDRKLAHVTRAKQLPSADRYRERNKTRLIC